MSKITVVEIPAPAANDDWAKVVGKTPIKPIFYRLDNGKEYSAIMGSIAWPTMEKEGCAMVVAATRAEEPTFAVLEAVFSRTPRELLRECLRLQKDYTPSEEPNLLHCWWGENLFADVLREVCLEGEKKETLIISKPVGFQDPNRDAIYIERIQSTEGMSIEPIEDELRSLTIADMDGKSIEDFPVAAAFAYAIHSLAVLKPWQKRTRGPIFYHRQ